MVKALESPYRVLWSDRNPKSKSIQYTGLAMDPHTGTKRASYTVPTGRKAKIHGAYAEVTTYTVATTTSIRYTSVIVQVGSTQYKLLKALLGADRTAVGTSHSQNVGEAYTLLPGEEIAIWTYDGSIGSETDLISSVLITEYDL